MDTAMPSGKHPIKTLLSLAALLAAKTAALTSYAEMHTLQPYAYVQSYGCNRVDTGYRANKDSRFVADCSFESIKKSWIYGCYSGQIHGFYLNGNTPTRIAWTTNGEHWWRTWNPGNIYIEPVVGRRLVSVVNSTDGTATMTYYENRTEYTSSTETSTKTKTTTSATANTVLFAYTLSNTEFVNCKLYSFEADDDCTSGVPAVFLAPTVDAEGNAGFTNIVDGTFHGEASASATNALSFTDGVGNANDYKYENATFYAKCYAYSADTGRGSVKFGTDAASGTASAWVARGGSVTLTAVPAEGWVFIGWTGDTWAISTGSASDAVVSVSNERAVQLLATFASEVDSARAYTQSGTAALILHLDAIDNAGPGLHEASPTVWVDLAGSHTVTNKGSAGFKADAWKADGSSYFLTSSAAAKNALSAKAFTLELVISHPSSQNKYEYWTYFGADSSHRQFVVDLRTPNSSNPLVQGVQYRESEWNSRSQFGTSAITKWNERQYIAVVCDSTGATTYCNGTNQIHKTVGGSVNPSQEAISIGASFNGDAYLYNGSEICSVRMTSRALTANERLRNWYVDSQRFGLKDAPDGYRFTNGVDQVRLMRGVEGVAFSTDGGTTWMTGEVWVDANKAVATVSVSLGDSAIGNQEGEKIASWSAKPQGVKFVSGDEGKNYMFTTESDGLYLYRGFSVFLY